MARIKDVAKEAGVAASTVSLVLNKKGYVSEETRLKVEAAVKKLNYIPSEMARDLSLQRTNIIGVIVPSISHPFFSELAEALETELYSLGYKMMLCCTKYKENSERKFIEMLKRQTMDGIIMGAHSLDVSIYEGLKEPVVAFDRYLNDNIPIVHCDHCAGGRLAAEAFLQHDCHHVIGIEGYQGVHTPANDYHKVFHETMRQHSVTTDILEMPWNAFTYEDFLATAEKLFTEYQNIDGIFGSDMAIASCMRVAAQRGYHIPQDIKMVAYDGTGMTQTGIQPITAVRQPIEKLASIAAQKVVSKVKGTKDNLPWVLQPRLLRGETCWTGFAFLLSKIVYTNLKKAIDKLLFYSYYRNIKPVRDNEREEKWGYFGERRNAGNKSAVSFGLSFDAKKWLD